MKEKFGQWWLDVAKYVFTGVILTSAFGTVNDTTSIYVGGVVLVLTFLAIGLYLLRDTNGNKNKKGKEK